MKRILSILLGLFLILPGSVAFADTFVTGGGNGVNMATDCNVATYYPLGTLCQDTDDGKLYKGTGAAVVEIVGTDLSAVPFLTSTASSLLSGEVNLGALTTGVLFSTVAGGTSTVSIKSIGTDIQAYDADLATIAGLVPAAGKYIIGGAGAWELSGYTLPTTLTIGDIWYASTTGAMTALAAATSGKFLQAQGAGTAPAYSAYTLPTTIGTAGQLVIVNAGATGWEHSSTITLTAMDASAVAPNSYHIPSSTSPSTEAATVSYNATANHLNTGNGTAFMAVGGSGLSGIVAAAFVSDGDDTLTNITGLTANVIAGKTYRFRAVLYVTSTTNGGVKIAVSGTATATSIMYETLMTAAGTTTQTRSTALDEAEGKTDITNPLVVIEGYILVDQAGTLTIQAAQNASHADETTIGVGSNFVVQQIL